MQVHKSATQVKCKYCTTFIIIIIIIIMMIIIIIWTGRGNQEVAVMHF